MNTMAKRILVAAIVVMAASGCGLRGNGVLAEEVRNLQEFRSLSVSEGIEAEVERGLRQSVRVVGDSNLLGEVRTEVRDGRLEVDVDEVMGLWPDAGLKVVVTVPSLESLTASAGAKAQVTGLDEACFALEAAAGSDVKLHGRVDQLRVELSGGSQVEARGLAAREAQIEASSGSQAQLQVTETLDVSASSGSEVLILGHPRMLRTELSSGAELSFE